MKYFFTVLAVLVLATNCSKNQQTGAALDDAFRVGVSADVQTLVSINLDRLKATEMYKRHEQMLQLPQIDTLAQRAGLDPRRDVSNLCMQWDGKHLLLMTKGKFSSSQLEQKLVSEGAQREKYKTFTLLSRGPDAVSFPERDLAVAAATPALQSTLDLISAHAGAIPAELKDRLAEIPSDAQIWEVSRGGLPAANLSLRSDIDSALSNFAAYVEGTSVGIRLDSGSHLQARFVCKSPEGAQRVNDAMRGLIGLGRLSTNDNELDLLRMWDAISITKDQNVVKLQADLAADLSDKLITKLSQFRRY